MSKAKLFVSLLVVALLVSFTTTSFAQQYPGDKAGHKADYLYSKLKLDKDQYTKVYQSLLSYEMKVKDLKGDKKAKAESLKKLQAEENTELGKIFNKDQATKFDGMKEKLYKMSFKKKAAVKKEGVTEEKKDATKDAKKDEKKVDKKDAKKDATKDVKKEEKKDAKKDVKKEEKKADKKDAKKDAPKEEKKDAKK